MNLWLRLLALVASAFWRPRLVPPRDPSTVGFRVWPHDLDTSLHMNNGRYWTLMDLGRADLMLRSGLWRAILKNGWVPVVSAGKIRFRRELKLFRAFELQTRVVAWSEATMVMEHRVVTRGRDGAEILSAIALVKAGLYDRRAKSFVPVERILAEIGVTAEPPEPGPEVAAFLAADEALKQAA